MNSRSVVFPLGRILAGCYWFCILIWVSTYTANLAAFFTVKNTEHPIQNLEELAKSTYQVGILRSSSLSDAFETSQYETHQKLWQRMRTGNTFVESTSQGIQWVRERENFVFIHDGPAHKYTSNQPPCDLTTGSLGCVLTVTDTELAGQGPVSRKTRKLFGPERKFEIKTCYIVTQFLAHKPVNFASFTNSCIVLFSKLLKLWSWTQTQQTENNLPGPKS